MYLGAFTKGLIQSLTLLLTVRGICVKCDRLAVQEIVHRNNADIILIIYCARHISGGIGKDQVFTHVVGLRKCIFYN